MPAHFHRRLTTRRKKVHSYSPTKDGCAYCLYGTDPRPDESICDTCVDYFMGVLRSKAWSKARLVHLDEQPLCFDCGLVGDNVHHTKPWRQFPTLFWDTELWQTLCQSDHSKHTVAEDGGFGRKKKTR